MLPLPLPLAFVALEPLAGLGGFVRQCPKCWPKRCTFPTASFSFLGHLVSDFPLALATVRTLAMLGSAWLAHQRKWRQQCADKKDWQMPTLKACKRWPSWQRTPLPWFYMVDRGLLCRMGWGVWMTCLRVRSRLVQWDGGSYTHAWSHLSDGVSCVMAPSDRIPPADLRVLISHGCKWTRTCVILSKNRNADTLKNWR